MKAFKCDGCKKFYKGDSHGEVEIETFESLNRNDINDAEKLSFSLYATYLIKVHLLLKNLKQEDTCG